MATTPVKLIKEFFGMTLLEMKREWIGKDGNWVETDPRKILTDKDRADLAAGLEDGSLTY
jgi:hypothetical protein